MTNTIKLLKIISLVALIMPTVSYSYDDVTYGFIIKNGDQTHTLKNSHLKEWGFAIHRSDGSDVLRFCPGKPNVKGGPVNPYSLLTGNRTPINWLSVPGEWEGKYVYVSWDALCPAGCSHGHKLVTDLAGSVIYTITLKTDQNGRWGSSWNAAPA